MAEFNLKNCHAEEFGFKMRGEGTWGLFMASKNYYDVTEWPVGNPYEDIGEVINSIIADIKSRQTDTD
ncbi:hypothetical protein, partial [Cohnella sp.]|uniref:hypothetical protein n=1 Tax=Cohnella sp. TaxID=1883426 RepID=UPI003562662B